MSAETSCETIGHRVLEYVLQKESDDRSRAELFCGCQDYLRKLSLLEKGNRRIWKTEKSKRNLC